MCSSRARVVRYPGGGEGRAGNLNFGAPLPESPNPGREEHHSWWPARGTYAHHVPGRPDFGEGALRWDLPRGIGGVVLHFSDLLGGPLAELLGLGALGAPALRQEVVDGLHVDHAQHVRAEGCQQVPVGKVEGINYKY